MLAFAVAAGTLYYVLRPTTLRIAVGPPGSDDQKLIQLMAQTFARDGSPVRLSLVTTEGTTESIALFNAGKADLAVARGDLSLPENAESVAILRKNVVVLWSTPGLPAKGKKQSSPKVKTLDALAGHRIGVIGRTEANVKLLRVILKESGIDPDKVAISQFGTNQINEMARDPSLDAFMANSCRSTSPTRSHRKTRFTNPRKSPAAFSVRRPQGLKTRSIPSASII